MRPQWMVKIAEAPGRFSDAVRGLDQQQLDTPYRPEGWTVRQVVHHVPDSHMNCFIRFRLALTEDEPVIKPYDEAKWAELHDSLNCAGGSLFAAFGLPAPPLGEHNGSHVRP